MTDAEYGNRRLPSPRPASQRLLALFSRNSTADISDAMFQAGSIDPGIRILVAPGPRFVGTAVTAVVPTGSREVRIQAIDALHRGDVLVIAGVLGRYALLGGRLARRIAGQGAVAAVVDGYVRDADELRESGIFVFGRGWATSAGPPSGPGEVNAPASCGGVVVSAGDLVVGDSNGVVVVPRAWATRVAGRLAALSRSSASEAIT